MDTINWMMYHIQMMTNIFWFRTFNGSKQRASYSWIEPDGPVALNKHLAIFGNTMSLYAIHFVESPVIKAVVAWEYVNQYPGMTMFNITMFRIYFEKGIAWVLITNFFPSFLFSYSKTKVWFAWLTMKIMQSTLQPMYWVVYSMFARLANLSLKYLMTSDFLSFQFVRPNDASVNWLELFANISNVLLDAFFSHQHEIQEWKHKLTQVIAQFVK